MDIIFSFFLKSILLLIGIFIGIYFLYAILRIAFFAIFKSYFDAKKHNKEVQKWDSETK